MSIIYDALQKTQKNQPGVSSTVPRSRIKAIKMPTNIFILKLMLVSLFMLLVGLATLFVKQHYLTHTPSLVLNGIFLSNTENVAVINQRQLHVGDTINNLRVVSIQSTGVQLKKGDDILTLENVNV